MFYFLFLTHPAHMTHPNNSLKWGGGGNSPKEHDVRYGSPNHLYITHSSDSPMHVHVQKCDSAIMTHLGPV